MEIRTTYIGTLDGIFGIWCGFKPDNAIITEERLVLYPKNDCLLKNKLTSEVVSEVLLKSIEQQEDWEEIPLVEDIEENDDND